MKELKYRDSKGKIHILKDVEIFTGCLDENGKEIYEGDIVTCGAQYRRNGKCKTDYWDHKVVVRGGYAGKTMGEDDIYSPYRICTDEINRPENSKRYSWSWSTFFDCIIKEKGE